MLTPRNMSFRVATSGASGSGSGSSGMYLTALGIGTSTIGNNGTGTRNRPLSTGGGRGSSGRGSGCGASIDRSGRHPLSPATAPLGLHMAPSVFIHLGCGSGSGGSGRGGVVVLTDMSTPSMSTTHRRRVANPTSTHTVTIRRVGTGRSWGLLRVGRTPSTRIMPPRRSGVVVVVAHLGLSDVRLGEG